VDLRELRKGDIIHREGIEIMTEWSHNQIPHTVARFSNLTPAVILKSTRKFSSTTVSQGLRTKWQIHTAGNAALLQ